MIASLDSCRARARAILGLLGALALASACATPTAPPGDDLLLPIALPVRLSPEPRDREAARLARAALASDPEMMRQALEALEETDPESDRLLPLAQDLVNSTLEDPASYRAASRALTEGWAGFQADASLKARLAMSIADDRLWLADRRELDAHSALWARTFNAVSQPLGSALLTGFILAPFTLTNSAVHYLASFSDEEPLETTGRQALALRKEFLARHPDAAQAPAIRAKVDDAEAKLVLTLQKRHLRTAKDAIKLGNPRRARAEANLALRHGPSARASAILARADAEIAEQWDRRSRSLAAAPVDVFEVGDAGARDLASALLTSGPGLGPISEEAIARYEQAEADGPRARRRGDVAAFNRGTAQLEAGFEDASWRTLGRLAGKESSESAMARHARNLIEDPWQDPFQAFGTLKRRQAIASFNWRILGSWAERPRYPNLWPPLAYLVDLPAMVQTVVLAPLRLVLGRWQRPPDFQRPTAIVAYRYLGLYPDGEHDRAVLEWLRDYEVKRGNSIAALRIADFIPEYPTEERAELAEKAAAQALAASQAESQAEQRRSFLRRVVREFPDTESGHTAGERVREELEVASPQRIRMTKSFLQENPRVTGPRGLGLVPHYINDDTADGELHPDGITLLGGRRLRFDLIGETGDEDDEPRPVFTTISRERLARLAGMLDETARRNQLIDDDDTLEPDADRDLFLERARLGLSNRAEQRPAARSSYVYRSMRERYGMVRGRDSILPFDLVVQGNFSDLTLGAFPRWRPPKETPDAFLYR